ncbi:MAG: molybdopterin-guanine dinucleotide biosynthesis protein B [Promethearchaeota archaeon]
MIYIQIIDVIGYSGSGKTNFIITAIKLFKRYLNYDVAIIKNVKHHQIDKEGKDSYKFTEAGATYSIIGNEKRKIAIFTKFSNNFLNEITNWLEKGPFKIQICLTEGFRNLNNPAVLCIKNFDEIDEQLTRNVKVISGIILLSNIELESFSNIPIIDIEKDFRKFLKIFKIK